MCDVLVTEQMDGAALDELRQHFDVEFAPELWRDEAVLLERVARCRALIVRNQTKVSRALIGAAGRLEVVGRAGAGLDNVDVAAATDAGVLVCYTPEQNAVSVAELAMGMLLALARRLPAADRSTRSGKWERQRFTGTELYGKTIGVVGFGRIGFLLAMRARAFGMRVLAHDPFVSPDAVTVVESGAEVVPLDELFARADVVSCHLPSTPATRGFFDSERLGRMKPSSLFLNLARGEVVDEPALIAALQSGRLAGAGLDVRATEPPAPSALDAMDNVILTPHVAAFTEEAQTRVVAAVCRDVGAVLGGRVPAYAANRPTPRAPRA